MQKVIDATNKLRSTLHRRENMIGLAGWLAGIRFCIVGDAAPKAVVQSTPVVISSAGHDLARVNASGGSCQISVDLCASP